VTSTSHLYLVPRFITSGITRLLLSLLICLRGVLIITRTIFIKLGENGVPSYVFSALSPTTLPVSGTERASDVCMKQKLVL
jgi:hypothetical protein